MSQKKKKKIKKLTDEEYGQYIMALKDERPPVPITVLQNDNENDE